MLADGRHPKEMDHRAFLKTLPAEELARLTEKSNAAGLAHLATHWGLIAIVGTLIVMRVPGWQALMPVQGVLVIFLFTLLHETCHATPFRSAWLNTVVGHVCGFVILLPATWFRYFHLAHHRHTQDPEKDPELASPKPESWRAYIVHISGLPIHASNIRTITRNAFGRCDDVFVPQQRRAAIGREARLMLSLYGAIAVAGIAFNLVDILYVWIVPLILGQPFLRLYLLAEHGRCPMVANMFENTRTTFTNRAIRWLAWNMPYHAEHHACPTVPFHRLAELNRLVADYLRQTEQGYVRFHRSYVETFTR